MPLAKDLLHPSPEEEERKGLVQSPNSYFMDVKCPGCYKIREKEKVFVLTLRYQDSLL